MNQKPLNAGNAAMKTGLAHAMAAVHHLNDAGSTVLSIELRQRKPVITIDGPHDRFLHGALKSRTTINGSHRCVMAAVVHGCQVEWTENYPVARAALQA